MEKAVFDNIIGDILERLERLTPAQLNKLGLTEEHVTRALSTDYLLKDKSPYNDGAFNAAYGQYEDNQAYVEIGYDDVGAQLNLTSQKKIIGHEIGHYLLTEVKNDRNFIRDLKINDKKINDVSAKVGSVASVGTAAYMMIKEEEPISRRDALFNIFKIATIGVLSQQVTASTAQAATNLDTQKQEIYADTFSHLIYPEIDIGSTFNELKTVAQRIKTQNPSYFDSFGGTQKPYDMRWLVEKYLPGHPNMADRIALQQQLKF